ALDWAVGRRAGRHPRQGDRAPGIRAAPRGLDSLRARSRLRTFADAEGARARQDGGVDRAAGARHQQPRPQVRVRPPALMRVRTVILAVAALAVIALAGGAWRLYASRDALIKRAIEHFGPELTGLTVTVKSVKLEPVEGRGAISGLEIGNTRGFSGANALTLGEMRLAVDPATLTSDVVRIREISLEAPNITYERGAQGDNLSAIQKRIESQLPKSKGSAGGKDASPQRKFIVDHVQVRGAKV